MIKQDFFFLKTDPQVSSLLALNSWLLYYRLVHVSKRSFFACVVCWQPKTPSISFWERALSKKGVLYYTRFCNRVSWRMRQTWYFREKLSDRCQCQTKNTSKRLTFPPPLACTHYVANESSFKVQLHWKIIFSAFMLRNTLNPIQNQVQHWFLTVTPYLSNC